MKNDAGNLSIDFLAGFTIFMFAFIWVATMIPGLLTGVSATAIDYDAVAYRTGAILVEDPGFTINGTTGWETLSDSRLDEISRMGFALTRDTPNIVSFSKINRTFSPVFTYPDDYQQKIIFGDHPYQFNISIKDFDNSFNKSVGNVRPEGYGYIRRVVMIKGTSNTTIDATKYLYADDNTTHHSFSVSLNMTKLLHDGQRPEYEIDPTTDPIWINITNIRDTLFDPMGGTQIYLDSVNVSIRYAGQVKASPLAPNWRSVFVDNSDIAVTPNPLAKALVQDKVAVGIPYNINVAPILAGNEFSTLYVNFSFSTSVHDRLVNNSLNSYEYYEYNYSTSQVTQPQLKPGIVEVAVW